MCPGSGEESRGQRCDGDFGQPRDPARMVLR